jgi:hypothetical protein
MPVMGGGRSGPHASVMVGFSRISPSARAMWQRPRMHGVTRCAPRLRPGRTNCLRWPRRLVRGSGATQRCPICRAPAALAALERDRAVASYQPYWALRVHLLCPEAADDEAIAAYRQAVGLSESPAAPDFLAREAAAVKE